MDANDLKRMDIVKDEIHCLMHEVELRYSIMAIIANKQDLPNAMSKQELSDTLELSKLTCKYQVFECTATKGIGMEKVISWISENMEEI